MFVLIAFNLAIYAVHYQFASAVLPDFIYKEMYAIFVYHLAKHAIQPLFVQNVLILIS